MIKKIITSSPAETYQFGKNLANKLKGGETMGLIGNLGSGKTTLVKGLAKGLGIKQTITSPTFVLMKVYKTKHKTIKQLVHVDCYRVPGIELETIGLSDYLNQPDTVVAIEWAEKIPKKFKMTIKLQFKTKNKSNERFIKLIKLL